MQVSTLSVLFMVITLIITLIMPLAAILVLCLKRKIHIIPVLVGAGVFFLFQLILRIPALQIGTSLSPEFAEFVSSPILGGLFLGLTAGIFEEFGRYIGYKTLLKRRTAWKDGFAFGLGHGGIESILIAGASYINNLIYAALINGGNWGIIASMMPEQAANQVFDALVTTAPHMFLVAGIERIFAMTLQVAFSILVLEGIRRRRFTYVLLAVFCHLVVDAPLALLHQRFGVFGTELFILLCALAALAYILHSRKVFAQLDAQQAAGRPEDQIPLEK